MISRTQNEIMKNWPAEWNSPVVSIRCITYNHEPYIAEALDGFLMQETDFPFEIVVHDDASTDNTANIIREYEAKYPKILKPIYETENQYSKHDGSLRKIMNNACKGKYIAFCEGDDYWIDSKKLQKQVDFLEKNPDYEMCYTNYKVFNQQTQKTTGNCLHKDCQIFVGPSALPQWLARTAYVAPMTWLVNSSLWKNACEFKMPSPDGTYVLFTYMLSKTNIKCLHNDETAVYRILLNSASHSTNLKNLYKRRKNLHSVQLKLIRSFLSEENAHNLIQLVEKKYYNNNENLKYIALSSDFEELKKISKWTNSTLAKIACIVISTRPISFFLRMCYQKHLDFKYRRKSK